MNGKKENISMKKAKTTGMSRNIKKPKEYEIDSFEKLCNVINEDNFEGITTDLILWLGYHVKLMATLRKKYPKITKDKTNWELSQTYFIWIDDGKNEMKHVVLKNKLTGEVKTFELSK